VDYSRLSVKQFIGEVNSGSINLEDFYAKLYSRVKELDKKHEFFVTIPPKQIPKKPRGKLAGLPISVKDNICTLGIQSTAGSKILKGYIPPFDATAVRRSKEEGASVIGKTNQDEFGFGTFSVNSGFGIPKNPLDSTRTCGGSSGGAGGITAALDFPHIAMSESTGGSITSPASFCGVVGLTPTYGRVSRYGLIDYANSLDKIGAIGKTTEDVALMMSVMAGHDPRDPTSIDQKAEGYTKYIGKSVKGMKIGVPEEYFGEEAKRRIILGTYSRMAGYRDQFYLKAMKVRTLIINDFKKAFSKYDVLVAPSMPIVAPKLKDIEKMSPLQNYMMDILTVSPNLAGIPMVSVPHGKVNGMPVGVHIMGDHLQEGKILQVASFGDKK